ncbi:MAG: hypothetical protein ACJ8AT_39725 [Hyalangium sp.]|uniref:hypothetical protein n=1 Tax=Hyalangium sp. TaxID=2028555 RepID=UPI00389AFABE
MGLGFRINVYNNTAQTLLVQSANPTGLFVYTPIHQRLSPGQFLSQEPLYYKLEAGAGGFVLNIFTPSGDMGFISLLLDENGMEACLPGNPCVATFTPASTHHGTHIFPFIALGVWGDCALGTINLVEVTQSVVQRPQVTPEIYRPLLPGL